MRMAPIHHRHVNFNAELRFELGEAGTRLFAEPDTPHGAKNRAVGASNSNLSTNKEVIRGGSRKSLIRGMSLNGTFCSSRTGTP